MSPWVLGGALVLGTLVGVLTGLFGVGGGFLMTPLLNIVLGVPMNLAVGTGAMQILGTSTGGLWRRRRDGLTDYKLAAVLFGGNLVGVRLGVQAVTALKEMGRLTVGGASVAAVDYYLLWVFVVMLSAVTAWLFYDSRRKGGSREGAPGLFSRLKLPPYSDFESLAQPRLSIPALAYLGLLLGFITGLLGIGGGVIILPALVYLVGMRTHRAAATSTAMVWLTSLVATISHALDGNTDALLAIPLLLGGSVGVQLGVSLCNRLGGAQLRRYFSLVVLAAALLVASKLAALLW